MSTPASSSNPFIPGDIVDGKYRVEAVLGEGGMGVVLAARHLTLESEVAVKVLLPRFQKDAVVRERFLREARAAAVLKSSYVTKIIDVGIDRLDAPYIVMERLHGQDLEKLLAEKGPLEEQVAIDYVLQACEALAEAHAAGIVHRDLKPENLFVTKERVKVLDFGISKASYEAKMLTATADVMGTPHFMSPEQFKSTRDVTARADVWSLGAILYRILTGGLPFEGKDYVDLCARIMTQAPSPIEHRRPNLSPTLCGIIRRCLDKDPMQRFANAFELRDALRQAQAQQTANHRLAMAATLPIDQASPAIAALAPLPPLPRKSPWPSTPSTPTVCVRKKRSYRGALFAVGALVAGIVTFGATHRTQVIHYVHPAPIVAEAPVEIAPVLLDAPASTLALQSPPEPPKTPAKVARRTKQKRAL